MNKKNKIKIDCSRLRLYPETVVVLVLKISEVILIKKSCKIELENNIFISSTSIQKTISYNLKWLQF